MLLYIYIYIYIYKIPQNRIFLRVFLAINEPASFKPPSMF